MMLIGFLVNASEVKAGNLCTKRDDTTLKCDPEYHAVQGAFGCMCVKDKKLPSAGGGDKGKPGATDTGNTDAKAIAPKIKNLKLAINEFRTYLTKEIYDVFKGNEDVEASIWQLTNDLEDFENRL